MKTTDPRRRERGAALVVAILVLAILTVIGIALMMITSTEARIAANEWSINRAFYSSDAGIRWASAEMGDLRGFLTRPEFGPKAAPSFFGTVLFNMSSHRFRQGLGFIGTDDIEVRVMTPGRLVTRRPAGGGILNVDNERSQWFYSFELRSTGAQDDNFLQYSKALVADAEIGPFPAYLPF